MTAPILHIVSSTGAKNLLIASAAKELEPGVSIREHVEPNQFLAQLRIDQEIPWQVVVADVKIQGMPMTCRTSFLPCIEIPAVGYQSVALNTVGSSGSAGHPGSLDGPAAQSAFTAMLTAKLGEAIASATLYRKLHSSLENLGKLNEREHAVLGLAAEGVPNKTIARRLNVSIKTIEQCRRRAYQKLGIKSAAEVGSVVTFKKFFSPLFGASVFSGGTSSMGTPVQM